MSSSSGQNGGQKPWGGRFSEATDPTVERFSASIHFDKVLARSWSAASNGSRARSRTGPFPSIRPSKTST